MRGALPVGSNKSSATFSINDAPYCYFYHAIWHTSCAPKFNDLDLNLMWEGLTKWLLMSFDRP